MRIHILFILITYAYCVSSISTSNSCRACIDSGSYACSNTTASNKFTAPTASICCSAAELTTSCSSYQFCQSSATLVGKYAVCLYKTGQDCGKSYSGYSYSHSSSATIIYGFTSLLSTEACVMYFSDNSPTYKTAKFKYEVLALPSSQTSNLYLFDSTNLTYT